MTPGAVRVGRHHVLLIFESQSILHRAWRAYSMAVTEDGSLKEEHGWAELGRGCIPVGFVCVGGWYSADVGRAAGSSCCP